MAAPLTYMSPPTALDRERAAPPDARLDRGWREAMLASSRWLEGQEGLDALATRLFTENVSIRANANARVGEILDSKTSAHVGRALGVGFELFVQSIALALDMREASKAADLPLIRWLRSRGEKVRGAGDRLLENALEPAGHTGQFAEAVAQDPDPMRAALARRLRICAEALGPTFVKFGQVLGSAVGLLPPEIVTEFGRCRDEVRPESFATIAREIERRLGPLDDVFAHIEPTPIAAASIAQVHAAELRNGQRVVVKVQRPGIRRRIEHDAALLHGFARTSEQVDLVGTANLTGVVELFAETVLEELDFRLEAENMIEFALCLEHAGVSDVVVPRPIPGLVTPTVLVMERLDGRPITDFRLRESSDDDTMGVLKVGTQAVLEGALTYGLFHADLHAGNILALPGGRFGLVDFGIMGRFNERQRNGLMHWMLSFATNDLSMQMDALMELGAFSDGCDVAAATEQIETVITQVESSESPTLEEVAAHFELIARILSDHGMRLPKELALFFKNLIHVSGAVRVLVPERNAYDEMAQILDAVQATHA